MISAWSEEKIHSEICVSVTVGKWSMWIEESISGQITDPFEKKFRPLDGKSSNSSRLFTSYSDVKFWNHSVFTFCTCFNNVFYCKCCQNQLFLNLNRKLDELRTNGSCLMVRWVRSGFVLMIEKRFSKVSDNGIIIWKPESRFLDEIWLHQVRGRPYS